MILAFSEACPIFKPGNEKKFRPEAGIPPRIIVIADSDAIEPARYSDKARRVVKAVQHLGIKVHIFSKRSIENYVPDSSLRSYAKKRQHQAEAVEVITSLLPPARDHYPMKTGLKEQDIRTGMYPHTCPEGVGLGNFMTDFLRYFAHTMEENELRSRDGKGELDRLLDLIEENL